MWYRSLSECMKKSSLESWSQLFIGLGETDLRAKSCRTPHTLTSPSDSLSSKHLCPKQFREFSLPQGLHNVLFFGMYINHVLPPTLKYTFKPDSALRLASLGIIFSFLSLHWHLYFSLQNLSKGINKDHKLICLIRFLCVYVCVHVENSKYFFLFHCL